MYPSVWNVALLPFIVDSIHRAERFTAFAKSLQLMSLKPSDKFVDLGTDPQMSLGELLASSSIRTGKRRLPYSDRPMLPILAISTDKIPRASKDRVPGHADDLDMDPIYHFGRVCWHDHLEWVGGI